jgi:hypothetical protein
MFMLKALGAAAVLSAISFTPAPAAAGGARARLLRTVLSLCQLPEPRARQPLHRPELPPRSPGVLCAGMVGWSDRWRRAQEVGPL